MSPMSLNEAQRVLENAANIFTALHRVKEVVAAAAGLEQGLAEKRQALDKLEQEIAAKKQEALKLAGLAVEAQAAHQQQMHEYEALIAAERAALARTREDHAAALKVQEAQFAEERSTLRQQHAAQVDAYQTEISALRTDRDAIAAALAELRRTFA